MTKPPTNWTALVVKFQTSAVTPPPYAYFYTLKITKTASGLLVDYDLQYLDRDEIDEESILEEGFTLNDDFVWRGDLDKVWQEELSRLLAATSLNAETKIKEIDNYIELIFNENEGTGTFPAERKQWDYFLQEVVQAIYESAGKERPFELEYVEVNNDRKSNIQITASFAQRSFTISLNRKATQTMPWKWARETMETVFQADFLADLAEDRVPDFTGRYLNAGEGLWYEFGESLVEPTPDSQVLPKIEKLFGKLVREAEAGRI